MRYFHNDGSNNNTPEFTFELINNGTAYSIRSGTLTGGNVTIPASNNILPVTEIGTTSANGYDWTKQ